ncbi:MAG TPA: CHASE3 domain-containing protein [Polyangiales bacterium]|nr:CHASE3 domain-containing protein [Polyangiales bacterium]
MKQLGVGTKIGAGFTVSLVMLVVVGWIARSNSAQLLETASWVSHTHEVLEGIARMTARVRESEAGARGYALTGDEKMLRSHVGARTELAGLLKGLHALTIDNPLQTRRIEELQPLVERKLKFQDELVRLRREQGLQAGAGLVGTGEGRVVMDEIHELALKMEETERTLLNRRQGESAESVRDTAILIGLSVLFAVLLVSLAGFLIARDISRQVTERERLLKATREAIQHLSSATAELLAATAQQGSGAQQQAAAIAETATTAEEIAQTATQSAERSQTVANVSQSAADNATAGKRTADDIVRKINELKERVASMAQSIITLSQHAQSIGELNTAVGEIAEQSNILALNAAIEASRAGEHGRGFSVVAEEVRGLAEQSKKATRSVRQLLGDMQRETNRAVIITEEGTKSADGAVRAANDNGRIFAELTRSVGDAAQAALQVAASASQQAVGVTQIQQAMRDINQVTAQSLASTRQIESASQDLNQLSTRLRDMVGTD